jgi:hypothetical protein
LDWTVDDWKKVLWSDESKFNMVSSDGKGYVRRPINKRFDPKYTKGTVKFGGGNIMVWGCFSWYGLGPIRLVTGRMEQIQYREILSGTMLPFARANMGRNWCFQHDNDPKHKAKTVTRWLETNRISVLQWPAQSPDLNPIENLWCETERRLGGRKFNNEDSLFNAVRKAWLEIPKERLERLVESMPRRCRAVIESRGYATKY